MMFGMIGMFILSLCVLLMKWKYVFVLKKYCVIVEFVLVFILCVKFLRLVFGECDCGWYFGQLVILMWNQLLCLVWMKLMSLDVQCSLLILFIFDGRLLCSVMMCWMLCEWYWLRIVCRLLCDELMYDRCGVVLRLFFCMLSMVLSVFCCVDLLVLNVMEMNFGFSGSSCVCVVCSFLMLFVVFGGKNLNESLIGFMI